MSAIDDQDVDTFFDQASGPLKSCTPTAAPTRNRPAYLCKLGKPAHLVDVFDRNKSRQVIFRQPAKVSRPFFPLKSSQLPQALQSLER